MSLLDQTLAYMGGWRDVAESVLVLVTSVIAVESIWRLVKRAMNKV